MRRKKVLKIILIILLVMIGLVTLSILGIFINHRIQLNQEDKTYAPPGELVEVNNQLIHVYAEGQGDQTLVFLSGHGTSYPTLDFKPLWGNFTEDHRIVVVERPGYGYSDLTKEPRDIQTMLEETRTALNEAGESGPYVLFAHSMSGIEALYWAQTYPEEVQAIIGLDPLIPDAVELLPEVTKSQLRMTAFMSRVGLSRLMPLSQLQTTIPLLGMDHLSEDEKNEYMALFYRRSLSRNMIDEYAYLKENALTVSNNDEPITIPMYFFISSEQDETVPGWKNTLEAYIEGLTYGESMVLNTGHYVHYESSVEIADEVILFLDALQDN